MPTAIRVSTPAPKSDSKSDISKKSDHNQLVSIALFSALGLLISLVAILFGVQGVWF